MLLAEDQPRVGLGYNAYVIIRSSRRAPELCFLCLLLAFYPLRGIHRRFYYLVILYATKSQTSVQRHVDVPNLHVMSQITISAESVIDIAKNTLGRFSCKWGICECLLNSWNMLQEV